MRARSFLDLHGRRLLKVGALVGAIALIGAILPIESPVPVVARVSMSLLADARQAIRKIAYINDFLDGMR